MYFKAMAEAGFEANTPLFVATGLLSYGAELEFQGGVSSLLREKLCSEVLYKEQYVPIFELQRKLKKQPAQRAEHMRARVTLLADG